MRRTLLALALLCIAAPALAQNPQCPTRPFGDSTNACASTSFVQQAVTGAFAPIPNAVLITSPSAVPGWATTLPSGLTIPAPIINGAATYNSTVPTMGTGTFAPTHTATCNYSGNFGAMGNPSCWNFTANVAAGTIGNPTGGIWQVNLNAPSGNPRGGYYNPFETQSNSFSGDGGWHTTLNGAQLTGASSIVVASATGILNGDFLYITLTNGQLFSTVAGTPSGTTIPISPSLPSGASTAAVVYGNKGILDGGIIQSSVQAGSSNLFAAIGATVTPYTATGQNLFERVGLSCENDIPSLSAGQVVDACIHISAQTGVTALYKTGIEISDGNGLWPIDPTGTIMSGKSLFQTTWGVANIFDFSGIAITGNAFAWQGTNGQMSLTGTGIANLSRTNLKANSVEFTLNDTSATVTTGGLQRVTGDGTGNYFWNINTAAGGDFSTSINVWEVKAGGIFNIINGLQLAGATLPSKTCGATIVVSSGIVTSC